MNGDGRGSSSREQFTSAKGRGRKICHRHAPQQIKRLEAYFKICPHPDVSQRKELCKELKLEEDQVKFWFQNKRTQTKVQDERSSNFFLRRHSEKIQCENETLRDAFENVYCPACGGPPFDEEERKIYFQNMRLNNAQLKEQCDKIANFLSMQAVNQATLMDLLAYAQAPYGTKPNTLFEPPTSQTMLSQPLSQEEIGKLSQTAASAVEELKRLFFTQESFWVQSPIDGAYEIDQESYVKFSHAVRHFKSLDARVESSQDVTVVPIEATDLIQRFLDMEKWKELFPTIVNKAKTILSLGAELPIQENCNILQLISVQLHILSPLVPPREFVILRCCQQIQKDLWIIAEASHNVDTFDIVNASCYKRPSGCIVQALPNAQSKVIWIEHVEVDDKDTHWMYKELLGGRSGYGAKRWILTLERMCERMALSSFQIIPATDWGEVINTAEGRRNVMKLGERMLRNFNEMLTMSGKLVDYPQDSEGELIRVSIRINMQAGTPTGLVISGVSSIAIPLAPLQVFNFLRDMNLRPQWDVVSHGSTVSEIARIFTGPNETNTVSILRPTPDENIGMLMGQELNDMFILQECYIDALGGMLVYAPINATTIDNSVSGHVNHSNIEILPSGFVISSDGSSGEGGTLLTVAFQVLLSGEDIRQKELTDQSVEAVSSLINTTVGRVKRLLNCR